MADGARGAARLRLHAQFEAGGCRQVLSPSLDVARHLGRLMARQQQDARKPKRSRIRRDSRRRPAADLERGLGASAASAPSLFPSPPTRSPPVRRRATGATTHASRIPVSPCYPRMIENSGKLGDVTAEQRPLQIERALLQFVQRRPRGACGFSYTPLKRRAFA